TMRKNHAAYFTTLVEESAPNLQNASSGEWFNRIDAEQPNLRAALGWSLNQESATAARLAASLRHFWIFRGHLTEGQRWLEAALECSNDDLDSTVRFNLLNGLGSLLWYEGNYDKARKIFEEGLNLSRAIGDKRKIALICKSLGPIIGWLGDYDTAQKYIEEAITISRELNDKFVIAGSMNALGDLLRVRGKNLEARPCFEESLAICRQLKQQDSVGSNLLNLGAVEFREGDFAAAGTYFAEAFALGMELKHKIIISYSLEGLGALMTREGQSKNAAVLAGAADNLRESIGYEIEPAERQFRDEYLLDLRAALSKEEFEIAFEQGSKLKMDEIPALTSLIKQ
ncbi:MAG: tetratricopeptide repeat protein, partial [Actinomycetota bacterium]